MVLTHAQISYLSNAEHLWVDLKTNQGIVVVGVVYRHPENSTHAIDDFNADLSMLILSRKTVLLSRRF